jgi:hypothetical protein
MERSARLLLHDTTRAVHFPCYNYNYAARPTSPLLWRSWASIEPKDSGFEDAARLGMGISMRLLAVVALLVAAAVAGAAAEEQAVTVDLAGAGEIAAGVKEAAEAAGLRAELAQLREKISALGQFFTARLASLSA